MLEREPGAGRQWVLGWFFVGVLSFTAFGETGCASLIGADFGDYDLGDASLGAGDGGRPGAGGSGTAGSSAGGSISRGGGAPGSGGNAPSSGGASTGGDTATGGAGATGGSPGNGGVTSSGGNSTTGGATSTGGSATGGVSATGGALTTGGSPATGGTTGSGGVATGGVTATGGAPSTGGATATGGVPSTGGAGAGGNFDAGIGCGNGVVDPGEECDDGNALLLDGCDSSCKYELFLRMDTFALQSAASPSWCVHSGNAFGASAFTATGLTYANNSTSSAITSAALNNFLQLEGLDDLTGGADPSLSVGVSAGVKDPAATWTTGSDPLDFPFFLSTSMLDAAGHPLAQMPASLSQRLLVAGPGTITLETNHGGAASRLTLVDAMLHATVGPTTSTPAPPPQANQMEPGLQVLEMLYGDASNSGLCGAITVQSLAAVPIPSELAGSAGCSATCSSGRTYKACGTGTVGAGCNSLLDALVGGCGITVLTSCTQYIRPTQPDIKAGGAPSLSLGTDNKVPASQTNANLSAYSIFYTFKAKREHVTGRQ